MIKGIIKFLVTVYVVITAALGGFTYLWYDACKSIKLRGKVKDLVDDGKKEVGKTVLFIIFCWPYLLIKNIKSVLGIHKSVKTAMSSNKVQATAYDFCDLVDMEIDKPKDLSDDEKEQWDKTFEEKVMTIMKRHDLTK